MLPTDYRVATPVDPERLSMEARFGLECIWCAAELTSRMRRHVGFVGDVWLFACPKCGASRRLPTFPEYGSA